MTQANLIGLSLSSCVKDIMAGKVRLDQVDKIIAGTKAVTEDDWDQVTTGYAKSFWSADPAQARAIVRELVKSGRIEQPRLSNEAPYSISQGYWVASDPAATAGVPLLLAMPNRTEIP